MTWQAVFCGADHTLAITRNSVKNLYSWGLNKKCQCGHPASRRKLDSPTPVPGLIDKKVGGGGHVGVVLGTVVLRDATLPSLRVT